LKNRERKFPKNFFWEHFWETEQKQEVFKLKPNDFKGRCTKKKLSKSTDVARLYDKIQIAYSDFFSDRTILF